MRTVYGLSIQVSPQLPIVPSPGEVGRRIVRHGLADVLRWLGEEVGPAPDEITDMLIAPDPVSGEATVFVSREVYESLVLCINDNDKSKGRDAFRRIHELRTAWLYEYGSMHVRFAPRTEPFRSALRDAMIGVPPVVAPRHDTVGWFS